MPSNNATYFDCVNCLFSCSKKSNYEQHLLTRKHLFNTSDNSFNRENATPLSVIQCERCNKKYKSRVGLWYHNKKCTDINTNLPDNIEINTVEINTVLTDNEDFKKLILEVVKSNTYLQKQNSELQKQMIEVCKNSGSINNSHINSHNKTFNLQFFLNEQCKDAMNISEFANSFELQLSDLESVGELGYVEGITKLMLDKLNSMDIYKRPIHCSDAKREILYVKDEDKWEKELRSNPKLRHAIKTVSFKNMKMANVWSDTYPDSKSSESHLNDVYMKLVIQSTGGKGEIGDNENKIIRRIAKEIVIDKNSLMK
jgi:hypothetical protein